jgi:hypothetical protein
MTTGGAWECPKCQTLNAFGDQCYSCGTARPGAPAQAVASTPVAPQDLGAERASAAQPAIEEDTELDPCWCNLIAGPHATRDHPASAAVGDVETDEEADARLDRLEIELGHLTRDWTIGQLKRSYADNDDGEQDYEDEMLIFEDHGYTKQVERHHHQIDATYTSQAARTGPMGWT